MAIKLLIKLHKSHKIHHRILQKQLKAKEKYLEKGIYLQGKNIIMEYQKNINLLDNTSDQPSKLRTNNWFKVNNDLSGTYNTNSQIKFKTSMLKSSLYNYSDAYILVSRTIMIAGAEIEDDARQEYERNKEVIKICVPFTDSISEINNTQVDNAKDLDVVMPM